jgi:hypothetical protein
MKRLIVLLCALYLALAYGTAFAESPVPAAFSNIPPAWSKVLKCDTMACPRFELVMGGAAVLDHETGLVWEKSPDTSRNIWVYAIQHCFQKELGERKGWRLPTVEELSSLIDPTQIDPALPPGHPFVNVQTRRDIFGDYELDYYWTATTDAGSAGNAWYVGFYNGLAGADIKTYNDRLTWCVRGDYGYDGR